MRYKVWHAAIGLLLIGCGGGGADTGPTNPQAKPVASVTVTLGSNSLVPGGSTTATVHVLDAAGNELTGRAVTWTSSASSVALVDGSGQVTAVGVGSAAITATSEGKTGAASLLVTPPPVATVAVTLSTTTLFPNGTTTATAQLRDAAGNVLMGRVITWASSSTNVAQVNAAGLITAVAPGTTTISASSEGVNGSATLTVLPPPVASVTVSLATSTLTPGATTGATVVLRDASGNVLNGRTVVWSSSAQPVAQVDATGQVTAIAPGSSNITAISEGITGTATLTVIPPPVASVTVSDGGTINTGATTALTATLRDVNGNVLTGRTITWATSSPSIASVSASGIVLGIAPGSATITATSEGKSGTALVIVRAPVTSVVITGSPRTKVGDSYTYLAIARLADGTVVDRPLTWSVVETAKGTMTLSGVLTPLQTGTITLRVTIDGVAWQGTTTAYDWIPLAGDGYLFAYIPADNLITNKFGSSEYAELNFACSPSGTFFVWVSTTRFVTQNGVVAYSFDNTAPVAASWDEISDYSSLFKPGTNAVTKPFALSIAAAHVFGFAFTEFQGSAKAMLFRVTGLNPYLVPLFAQCPGNSIVAADAQQRIASARRAPDSTEVLEMARVMRRAAGPVASATPTIAPIAPRRITSDQIAIRVDRKPR